MRRITLEEILELTRNSKETVRLGAIGALGDQYTIAGDAESLLALLPGDILRTNAIGVGIVEGCIAVVVGGSADE